VLEGSDLGAAPREIFGDSDYEYWLTIRAEDKGRVLEGLLDEGRGGDKDSLILDLLVERFGRSNQPVSDIREWLEERGIPYAFDSYA